MCVPLSTPVLISALVFPLLFLLLCLTVRPLVSFCDLIFSLPDRFYFSPLVSFSFPDYIVFFFLVYLSLITHVLVLKFFIFVSCSISLSLISLPPPLSLTLYLSQNTRGKFATITRIKVQSPPHSTPHKKASIFPQPNLPPCFPPLARAQSAGPPSPFRRGGKGIQIAFPPPSFSVICIGIYFPLSSSYICKEAATGSEISD